MVWNDRTVQVPTLHLNTFSFIPDPPRSSPKLSDQSVGRNNKSKLTKYYIACILNGASISTLSLSGSYAELEIGIYSVTTGDRSKHNFNAKV